MSIFALIVFLLWLLFTLFQTYGLVIPHTLPAARTTGTAELASLLTTFEVEVGAQKILGQQKLTTCCSFDGDEGQWLESLSVYFEVFVFLTTKTPQQHLLSNSPLPTHTPRQIRVVVRSAATRSNVKATITFASIAATTNAVLMEEEIAIANIPRCCLGEHRNPHLEKHGQIRATRMVAYVDPVHRILHHVLALRHSQASAIPLPFPPWDAAKHTELSR